VSEDRVAFTRASAQRIAKAVRIVEAGDKEGGPINFGVRLQDFSGNKTSVRFCSWTGTWGYNSTASITFASGTAATATATNVILGVGPGDGWVARKGTAGWSLVAFDITKQPGYSGGEIQLFGHDASAVAYWYSITTCATATESVPDEYGWFF
jgi:hypothetical protein